MIINTEFCQVMALESPYRLRTDVQSCWKSHCSYVLYCYLLLSYETFDRVL